MLVGTYLIVQTLLNYYYRRYRIPRTVFMIIVWGAMVVLFYNPSWAALALPLLSTQDVIMSVLVIGILGSLIMVAYVMQNVAKLEKQFTELVENLSIKDYVNEVDSRQEVVDLDDGNE